MSALNFPYDKEPWQVEQLHQIISCCNLTLKEILVIRARNGSKTEDMMILALYLAYLGYDVIFYVAFQDQQQTPSTYMNKFINRSFLADLTTDLMRLSVFFTLGGSVRILNLTENKARSPRADVLIFDEEGQADENAYNATAGIMKSSTLALKIHCSTPIKGSVFEDNYNVLLKRQERLKVPLVLIRKWFEIGFLKIKEDEYEADRKRMPKWLFRQEHECSFESPAGSIFTDVIYGANEISAYINNHPLNPKTYSGIDWNPVAGHYVVSGKWTRDGGGFVVENVFKFDEFNHATYQALKPLFMGGNSLCLEDGGANMGFVKWFDEEMENDGSYGQRSVYKESWNVASKHEAVIYLMTKTLMIDDKRFEELAVEVDKAHWDEEAKEPKMHKDSSKSPHYVDSLLHAASPLMANPPVVAMKFNKWRR